VSVETPSSQRFSGAPSDEGGYLLAIVAAVSAAGGREVQIATSNNEVSASFDHVEYSPRLLADLVAGDLKGRPWTERTFAVACRAGLLAGAPRVDFESWNGKTGVRWKVTPEGAKEESLTKSPWKGASPGARLIVRFRTGLSRELFRVSGGGEQNSSAVSRLADRAKHSGVRILVDGKQINSEIVLGKGLLELVFSPPEGSKGERVCKISCSGDLKRQLESRGSYYAHFLFGGDTETNQLVCRGLNFPVELPLADELGFSGVVVANHLSTNAEMTELLENTDFDDLLNDVESDLLSAAAGLIDVLDDIDDDNLEHVLETLDMVVETHRSAGDIDEAIAVLQKLVEAPKLPNYARAAHLTQLAVMLERADRAEESFDIFNSALNYWGEVDGEHQDLELVATALLGAARLMSIYDDEPESAIDYTRRALELRRSVSDEEDPERGVAAELLGRLYLKHSVYPEPEFMEIEPLLKEALTSFEQNYGKSHGTVPTIMLNLGEFYRQRGSFEEAESYFLKALAIREKLLGSRSEQVGEIFDRLGAVFETEGDIPKAGQYYFRSLEVWEHILGPTHDNVIARINDLVVLYRVYGHFDRAEPLYLKLLKLREGDADAPSVQAVPDLCALALFYQVQSKYAQAEPLLQKALTTLHEHYGADANHPDLAWVHGLCGRFFAVQYRFKKAEEHLLTSLQMSELILGDEHPDLIVCLEALSRHYRIQKRYFEAMECAERALAIAEQFYGTQHPYVATALNSFAELLCAAGDEEAAGPVYVAAFEIHETSANILLSRAKIPQADKSRLARVRKQAEELHVQAVEPAREYSRFAEAESLYLRALFMREQVLGPDHFDNARTLELLAALYRNHRRYEGAETLYKRALSVRQTHLGNTHPDCGLSLRVLTETLLMQDKFDEAEPLLKEWLGIIERTLGNNHSERAEILMRLAKVSESRGHHQRQLDLLQESVTIRHGVFGTEHPTFAVTLAEMLRVENKPVQAAELYDFVLTSLEKNMGEEDPLLIPILENYAKVLSASGKDELAAPYETRAMIMRAEYGLDFG
jgi:tetratricopeptide (TPR) repeat protein